MEDVPDDDSQGMDVDDSSESDSGDEDEAAPVEAAPSCTCSICLLSDEELRTYNRQGAAPVEAALAVAPVEAASVEVAPVEAAPVASKEEKRMLAYNAAVVRAWKRRVSENGAKRRRLTIL